MPEKSYDKQLTKTRLVNILQEQIFEERQGIERYEKIWNLVFKTKNISKVARQITLDSLNEIMAEEIAHVDLLEEALSALKKY